MQTRANNIARGSITATMNTDKRDDSDAGAPAHDDPAPSPELTAIPDIEHVTVANDPRKWSRAHKVQFTVASVQVADCDCFDSGSCLRPYLQPV